MEKKGDTVPVSPFADFPDLSDDDKKLIKFVSDYTMTSVARQVALINAVRYVLKNNLEGDFTECGVWRGGSSMIMAELLAQNQSNKKLYMYDTYDGMSEPTKDDVDILGKTAEELLKQREKNASDFIWAYATIEDVKNNLAKTKLNPEQLIYVKGKVEDTIPENAPEKICILRLDTDWYESTYHELKHLYPRLVSGGVLIIDDYGHWQGAKKAVDKYIEENQLRVFMMRADYTGRIIVKP
jgi:hypothetical protein